MQIIENVSRIDGPIVDRRPSTEQPDWDDITVLLVESYCVLAPKALARLVDRT